VTGWGALGWDRAGRCGAGQQRERRGALSRRRLLLCALSLPQGRITKLKLSNPSPQTHYFTALEFASKARRRKPQRTLPRPRAACRSPPCDTAALPDTAVAAPCPLPCVRQPPLPPLRPRFTAQACHVTSARRCTASRCWRAARRWRSRAPSRRWGRRAWRVAAVQWEEGAAVGRSGWGWAKGRRSRARHAAARGGGESAAHVQTALPRAPARPAGPPPCRRPAGAQVGRLGRLGACACARGPAAACPSRRRPAQPPLPSWLAACGSPPGRSSPPAPYARPPPPHAPPPRQVFVPMKPGTYPLRCSVKGHAEGGMAGSLVVKPAAAP
jgi:hypothetical protein